jgi:hypothetical protein
MRRTSLDFLANSSEKLGQETQQSNMDEGFPPLPFSNPTHSVSAKSENSPPFLFVNELLNYETNPPGSNSALVAMLTLSAQRFEFFGLYDILARPGI